MAEQAIIAVKLADIDNVASIFADVATGTTVLVRDNKGKSFELVSKAEIPYGHKICIKPVKRNEPILKYGEEIGIASKDIAPGEHVHVHNLDSNRGRGDRK
ncbi:MAG: UxaA family hydrolase [Fusobacteriaceae bacterium]|nr:UxaA family hydrolase [Fusobacteriaceae bacterium]